MEWWPVLLHSPAGPEICAPPPNSTQDCLASGRELSADKGEPAPNHMPSRVARERARCNGWLGCPLLRSKIETRPFCWKSRDQALSCYCCSVFFLPLSFFATAARNKITEGSALNWRFAHSWPAGGGETDRDSDWLHLGFQRLWSRAWPRRFKPPALRSLCAQAQRVLLCLPP